MHNTTREILNRYQESIFVNTVIKHLIRDLKRLLVGVLGDLEILARQGPEQPNLSHTCLEQEGGPDSFQRAFHPELFCEAEALALCSLQLGSFCTC